MCCATRYAAQSLPFSRCWAQYTTEIYRCQVICKVRAGKVSIEMAMQACLQKSSKCERAHDRVTKSRGGGRCEALPARKSPKCERNHDRAALQRGVGRARKRVTCTNQIRTRPRPPSNKNGGKFFPPTVIQRAFAQTKTVIIFLLLLLFLPILRTVKPRTFIFPNIT